MVEFEEKDDEDQWQIEDEYEFKLKILGEKGAPPEKVEFDCRDAEGRQIRFINS